MKIVDTFEEHVDLLNSMGVSNVTSRTKDYFTKDYPDGLCISHDSHTSHIEAELLTVPDVQTLKSMVGIDDAVAAKASDNHQIDIPPHVADLEEEITDPMHPHVCRALDEFVFGHSEKVDSWVPLVNDLRFPMTVAVASGKSVTVAPGHPLLIGDDNEKPVAAVFDTITVEKGGEVIGKAPAKVVVTDLVSKAPAPNSSTITLQSIGGDGGNGGNGGGTTKPAAAIGGKGSDATTSGKSDCEAAGVGGIGGNGVSASSSTGKGGKGGDANSITFNLTTLTGSYTVGSVGGNGGNGGNGGSGQNGGEGGPGGSSCRDCGTGAQGPGGPGGDAGPGGKAGDGGAGAKVYINYKQGSPSFKILDLKANGGSGGNAGTAGAGGSGKPTGSNGKTANPGDGGAGGQPGEVIINGVTTK